MSLSSDVRSRVLLYMSCLCEPVGVVVSSVSGTLVVGTCVSLNVTVSLGSLVVDKSGVFQRYLRGHPLCPEGPVVIFRSPWLLGEVRGSRCCLGVACR